MPKKLKQKLLSSAIFNIPSLPAGKLLIMLAFVFGGLLLYVPKVFATDFPINNVTVQSDIEINGKKDNLLRLVKGQTGSITVDLTVTKATDATGTDASQIVMGTDTFDFNVNVFSKRPILAFGAGLGIFGSGSSSMCSNSAISGIIPFFSNSSSFLDCTFSISSNKISSGPVKVGQTNQFTFQVSPSTLSALSINPNQTSGTTQSFSVYPYFDMSVVLSGTHSIAFSNAGKQVYVQIFNSQADLDAASTTRPTDVPNYGSNSGNAGSNNAPDAIQSLIVRIILIIAGIINQLVYFIFYWLIAPLIQAMLSIHTYQDSFVNVIYAGWEIVRNVCNILFIIAIIAMGMGTLLRVESYQWKHLLVQLVVAALLVNFSLVIGQAILAFADTIQSQFLPNNVDVIRSLARDLMVANTSGALSQSMTATGNFSEVVKYLFWVALAIGSFLVFAALVAFLFVRIVALWVLLMLSPIAYVARILPTTKNLSGLWWTNFLKYAFFTPVIAFFLNMAAVISNNARNSPVLQQISASTFSDSNFPGFSDFVFKVASNIILLVFLLLAINVANKFGVLGGDALKEVGEKGVKLPFTWTGKKAGDAGKNAGQWANQKKTNISMALFKPGKDDGFLKSTAKRAGFRAFNPGLAGKAAQEAKDHGYHDTQADAQARAQDFYAQKYGHAMTAEAARVQGKIKAEQDKIIYTDKAGFEAQAKNAISHAHSADEKAVIMQAYLNKAIENDAVDAFIRANGGNDDNTEGVLKAYDEMKKAGISDDTFKTIRDKINKYSGNKKEFHRFVGNEAQGSADLNNARDKQFDRLSTMRPEELVQVDDKVFFDASGNFTEQAYGLMNQVDDQNLRAFQKLKTSTRKKFADEINRRRYDASKLNNTQRDYVMNNLFNSTRSGAGTPPPPPPPSGGSSTPPPPPPGGTGGGTPPGGSGGSSSGAGSPPPPPPPGGSGGSGSGTGGYSGGTGRGGSSSSSRSSTGSTPASNNPASAFQNQGLDYSLWNSAGFDDASQAKDWDDALKTVKSNPGFNSETKGAKTRSNYAKRWRDAGYSLEDAKTYFANGDFEPPPKTT